MNKTKIRGTYMKIRISKMLSVLAAGAALVTVANAGPDTSYSWQFTSPANPAIPETVVGGTTHARAIVAPGGYADGWIATNAVLGSAQGVWDLGSSGAITLNNPDGLAGASAQPRLITVSVKQYQDGAIYNQAASVSLANATLVLSKDTMAGATLIGEWQVHQTQWRVEARTELNSLVVSGAASGTLVDSIIVESELAASTRPQLAIRKLSGSQVEISWPSTFNSAVLESATNPAQSWTPITAQAQIVGDRRVVTIDTTDAVQCYRLRQP